MSELSTPGGRGDPSPPGGFPIVEAIGISKRYGATVALSDAHIRVMPGSRTRWSAATAPASRRWSGS